MLISQTGIGSVLKQSCNDSDDDEDIEMVEESDVFGITSVLNLTNHKVSVFSLQHNFNCFNIRRLLAFNNFTNYLKMKSNKIVMKICSHKLSKSLKVQLK